MKLPAIIRGDTVGKLEKARSERDRVEAVLSDLASQRDSLDFSADDFSTVSLTIDGQIQVHRRAIEVADRQIAGLESKVAEEGHAELARRRAAAIKVVEQRLLEREEIVGEIEAAIKALPHLFEKLATWRAKFVRQYPIADVEFPYAHFIDSDRVLRIVVAALRNIRFEDFHERIDGLAASEAEQHAALIADLKANPISNTEKAA